MPTLFAFLHHLAFLALAVTLTVQLVVLGQPLTVQSARKLGIADRIVGASAVALLIVGLLRVYHFEKGADYYFHNAAFHAKLALFALAATLSAIPTLQFLAWRREIARGQQPQLPERRRRWLRIIVHTELTALVGMALCGALMAKGIGYFG
ncbi:DUF2214 family protein [Microbulbifer agarilyticus]|uniref:DUF2214 family protein n=1 Tax=Microbulbifer agarilyticus TaxID=260552 RepID=UPI001C9472A6|nr:DUF2214 family protein [Microbulbifer agarilyticus]MBY6212984.1 DUF2214 family protein [Microbulbifer agarilyticus]